MDVPSLWLATIWALFALSVVAWVLGAAMRLRGAGTVWVRRFDVFARWVSVIAVLVVAPAIAVTLDARFAIALMVIGPTSLLLSIVSILWTVRSRASA